MIKFNYEFTEHQEDIYMGKFLDIKTDRIIGIIFKNQNGSYIFLDKNKKLQAESDTLEDILETATTTTMLDYENYREVEQ